MRIGKDMKKARENVKEKFESTYLTFSYFSIIKDMDVHRGEKVWAFPPPGLKGICPRKI